MDPDLGIPGFGLQARGSHRPTPKSSSLSPWQVLASLYQIKCRACITGGALTRLAVGRGVDPEQGGEISRGSALRISMRLIES
jgi:hypothetical protein